jgi:hypothetical protein
MADQRKTRTKGILDSFEKSIADAILSPQGAVVQGVGNAIGTPQAAQARPAAPVNADQGLTDEQRRTRNADALMARARQARDEEEAKRIAASGGAAPDTQNFAQKIFSSLFGG